MKAMGHTAGRIRGNREFLRDYYRFQKENTRHFSEGTTWYQLDVQAERRIRLIPSFEERGAEGAHGGDFAVIRLAGNHGGRLG